MSRDGHSIAGPHGAIRIEGDALAGLVVSAVGLVDGARVRRPRRGLDVSVAGGAARVELELAVRYGAVVPVLARAVQESVTEALLQSAGLVAQRVDVSVEVLDR
jgi:uncharacterized alkaline shock family protein YloU